MQDEFKPVHGFYLNISKSSGAPSIFLQPVFPDSIVDAKSLGPGGAAVTLKMPDDRTALLEVTQTVDEIRAMIARCKELDARV